MEPESELEDDFLEKTKGKGSLGQGLIGQWSIGLLVCRQRVLKTLSSLGSSRPAEVLWRHCCQPNMGGQQWRHLPPGPNLKPSTLEHARFAIISRDEFRILQVPRNFL